MEISAGKLRGLRRLADKEGRFKMVAVDQRPPMLKALGEKLAPRTPGYDDLAVAKSVLTRHLGPLGSAILIDPDYGFSRAEPDIPADRGLLITLEDFRFDETPGGRKTRLPPDWSVAKIKRMGADGVKLLLWYRPDADLDVVRHQQDLVRSVGEECTRYDIAFLLELLVYPFAGGKDHTTDYIEHKDKRPELVLQSIRDFADASYGVDIYKLESPVPAAALPDPDQDGPDTRAAQDLFNEIGTIINMPWVMLSAGAGMDEFRRVLGFAYRAGANGYLAGRAIWWKAFEHFPDEAAVEQNLTGQSASYMQEINELTDRRARPWTQASAMAQGIKVAAAGHEFPQDYADLTVR